MRNTRRLPLLLPRKRNDVEDASGDRAHQTANESSADMPDKVSQAVASGVRADDEDGKREGCAWGGEKEKLSRLVDLGPVDG